MLTYGNSVVKIGGGWVDHITLPANTLRYRFSKADLDPRAYVNKGTFTKVSGSAYNDWDWTYNNSSWVEGPFLYAEKGDSSLGTYEIIAAGDTSGVTSFNAFFGYYGGNPVYFGPTKVCQINTRNATNMADMFRNCLNLVEVGSFDITSVVTSAATGLVYMFAYTAITEVPVFKGSKVITGDSPFFLSGMFQGCTALSDISNLHTIRVSWDLSTAGTNSGLIINAMFADIANPLFSITGHEWDGSGSRIKNFNSHLVSSSQRSAFAGCTFKNDMINVLSWPLMNTSILTDLFRDTGMTSIPTIPTITASTLGFSGAFADNPDIDTGMLAAYNYLKTLQGVSGSNCFQNSGTDTVQGMSDRASIPEAWGGDYVVPAVTVGTGWSKAKNSSSDGTIWKFTSNIDFSTLVSMQLYTDASISSYAGVNMRKTNIGNRKGNFSNATSSPCFYYPAFIQVSSSSTLTWFMTSTSYNGTLAAGSSAGDMPGTLSYNTYGDHSVQIGTYDSTKSVRFCFLVFNTDTLDASCLSNFGILYNGNFYVDPKLKAVGGTVDPQSAIIG